MSNKRVKWGIGLGWILIALAAMWLTKSGSKALRAVCLAGSLGGMNGPFFRAVVRRGNSLVVGRIFINGPAHVAEVKALRPGRTLVEIERRYFTGGIRINATGQPVPGRRRGFYSPWQPIEQINFVVTAGPCLR